MGKSITDLSSVTTVGLDLAKLRTASTSFLSSSSSFGDLGQSHKPRPRG